MKSITRDKLDSLQLPQNLITTIRLIGEYKGKQDLYKQQKPEVIENLRQVAIVQSTESSNRIEGIVADHKRIEAIIRKNSKPKNRPESEIAGYRDVLSTIHDSYENIPFRTSIILQFHRDLMKYTVSGGGEWKGSDNEITTILPDGTKSTRFRPVAAFETKEYMRQLHYGLEERLKENYEPLLLIPAYLLDFLCIHPFNDGNGRMSRLLTILLLNQNGYDVAKYISLERVIEQTKESYYDTLYSSSQNWYEAEQNLLPWIEYWLSTVLAAYREFESRVDLFSAPKTNKSGLVKDAIERIIGEFTTSDLCNACPEVSRDLVKKVLNQLRRDGILSSIGKGRGAKWIRNG